MKNWKLIILEVEKLIRWFALVIGIGSSVISAMLCIATFNIMEQMKNLNSEKTDGFTKTDSVLAFLCVFTPLVISIFILIATRKFKELNQLIEENKKL